MVADGLHSHPEYPTFNRLITALRKKDYSALGSFSQRQLIAVYRMLRDTGFNHAPIDINVEIRENLALGSAEEVTFFLGEGISGIAYQECWGDPDERPNDDMSLPSATEVLYYVYEHGMGLQSIDDEAEFIARTVGTYGLKSTISGPHESDR